MANVQSGNKPKFEDLDLIVFMKFGSHLYGTDTSDSDKDYIGVYMPTKEQIFLQNIPEVLKFNSKEEDSVEKNTKDDTDTSIYSFHQFIDMACDGKTEAMDMLHAPCPMLIKANRIWDAIKNDRSKFYCKNLQSMSNYVQKQAAKYGIKGSRLNDAQRVIDFFTEKIIKISDPEQKSQVTKITLADVWDDLPKGEHLFKLDPPSLTNQKYRTYSICEKLFQETAKLEYIRPIIKQFIDNYGHRARLASKNEGIDWKAVSHALRAAYQIREILVDNTITFPLFNAGFLKAVKLGQMDFTTEVVPILESLMKEINELLKHSKLPEKVDREGWNQFIVNVVEERYF